MKYKIGDIISPDEIEIANWKETYLNHGLRWKVIEIYDTRVRISSLLTRAECTIAMCRIADNQADNNQDIVLW